LSDTEKLFTSYDIQTCLFDLRRVEYFRKAIFNMVRPGDIVVDGGSGSGVLGMLAAQAGAARVYCVEINPEHVEVIEENAARNDMSGTIVAMAGDASRCDLPEDVDVIVSEVISAGFFYEPQLQILNNLRRFLKVGGSVIPIAMDNYIELIHAQEKLYDLTFTYEPRFRPLKGDTSLTEPSLYLSTTFGTSTETSISAQARLLATSSGTANAVRISYRIQFEPGQWVDEPTEFLMNPQIIFLPEPVRLTEKKKYVLSIAYESSSAPLSAKIDVRS
jgi:protein arginine N-methyltransferase 1